MMGFLQWLELASKLVSITVGVLTLYIGMLKVFKIKKSKRKRNASDDVPN